MSTFSAACSVNTPATSFTEAHESESDSDSEPEPTFKYYSSRRRIYLKHYLRAQDSQNIYKRVLTALRKGHRKPQPATWLWCVFPHMDFSKTSARHSDQRRPWDPLPMADLNEARAILTHPVLGPRVRDAAQALVDSPHADVFMAMDNMFYDVARLHSSITVFRQAARYPVCIHKKEPLGENYVFRRVLDKYFTKDPDSEDDDYRSEDEDKEVQRRGRRHGPTVQRLDAMELAAIEQRLATSTSAGCVCGHTTTSLQRLDRGSKEKMKASEARRVVKNLKMSVSLVPQTPQ